MSEESDYFFADLEFRLHSGLSPMVALEETVKDYAAVYLDIIYKDDVEPDWPVLLRVL